MLRINLSDSCLVISSFVLVFLVVLVDWPLSRPDPAACRMAPMLVITCLASTSTLSVTNLFVFLSRATTPDKYTTSLTRTAWLKQKEYINRRTRWIWESTPLVGHVHTCKVPRDEVPWRFGWFASRFVWTWFCNNGSFCSDKRRSTATCLNSTDNS